MSARKPKTVKSAESSSQYGSKFVAGSLDNLIAQKLNRCKYPKATQKWLSKLRSSILQKVSRHSKVVFQSEATNASTLKANIATLQEKVQAQRAHIKQLLLAEEKETSLALAQRLPSAHAPYEAGQFSDSASRIGGQFQEVAKLLLEVTHEIENRNAVLEGNLSIATTKLPAVLQAMEQRQAESAKAVAATGAVNTSAGRQAAAAGGKKGTTGTTAVSSAAAGITSVSNKDALQQVHKLFGKK